MRARFSPPNDLELRGNSSELAALRRKLEDDSSSSFQLQLEPHDPQPYSQALAVLSIDFDDGPVRVGISGGRISLSGSRDNIKRFASFLDIRPGEHNHYEYYPVLGFDIS